MDVDVGEKTLVYSLLFFGIIYFEGTGVYRRNKERTQEIQKRSRREN